ncbi:PAS domain S-box protein [Siculibacillus lacustris]|uniref:PAS domain S-box protein n=1 Tax=Siculibacillus lacustris TaxID=1549641 RepID=A0A4Q9VIX6_9HYPH|nr:PAS domain-containing protein [Siculibacillus lacustris]TBW35223.1 PAS domain S-box protein [Siculibacillus lacustris]
MAQKIVPTNREVTFAPDEIIVSKTDLKGKITYANRTFSKVCGYSRAELMGAPHSIIRHPDMPRAVFKLLWDRLAEEKEVFAYVKNMTRWGDYYWVFAHVTPSYDDQGRVVGYHSNRRVPEQRIVRDVMEPVYAGLLATEASYSSAKEGLKASYAQLTDLVKSKATSYDELIFSL